MLEFPRPEDPLNHFAIGICRSNGSLLRNGDRITMAIGQSRARWHVLGMAEINVRNETWSQHMTPKLGSDNLSLLARQMEQIAAVLEQNEPNQGV